MTERRPRYSGAVRALRDARVELTVVKRRASELVSIAEDAEAERDRLRRGLFEQRMEAAHVVERLRVAEAAVAGVLALHVLDPNEPGHCVICQEPYPCETLRALNHVGEPSWLR